MSTLSLPDSQADIKEIKTNLEAEIEDRQNQLAVLQKWCQHPNAVQGEWLGRKGYRRCADCGFHEEWWL